MTSWADSVDIDEDIIRLGPDIPHHRLLSRKLLHSPDPEDNLKRAEVREWINSFPQPRTIWDEIIIASKNRYNDQYNSLGINISGQNRRQLLFDWTHVYYSKKTKP